MQRDTPIHPDGRTIKQTNGQTEKLAASHRGPDISRKTEKDKQPEKETDR